MTRIPAPTENEANRPTPLKATNSEQGNELLGFILNQRYNYCAYWLEEVRAIISDNAGAGDNEETKNCNMVLDAMHDLTCDDIERGANLAADAIFEREITNSYIINVVKNFYFGDYTPIGWDDQAVDVVVQYAIFGKIMFS